MTVDRQDLLRTLPGVDALAAQVPGTPRVAVAAARQVVAEARAAILAGSQANAPDLVARATARAQALGAGRLRPVLNATGVVVHTNLGRAPWSAAARDAAVRAAGYCDLELRLDTGTRGGRLRGLRAQLQALTGAEDALVVNNNAAAVLLALTALARDREVVVSRGELVEIGGSFRVPDVIASGGARLVEVGTTNRTRAADYEAAIGDQTGVLLRVHTSNFRIIGFTEAPDRAALVSLGKRTGVPVVEDVGAGSIEGLADELAIREVVAAGVDVVCFSGDKLLGGPQAGVLVGRSAVISRLRAHALYRALRVDKVVLAALEATLGAHLAGDAPPALAMITVSPDVLHARATALVGLLADRGLTAQVLPSVGFVGGGALPGQELPGFGVRLQVTGVEGLARALRMGSPAVVPRRHQGALWLEVRTLADDELATVADRVAAAIATR